MKQLYLFLRWFFGMGPPKPPRYARVDLDDWRLIEPGEVRVLKDMATGESWGLMHIDDLDHMAQLSNLRRRPTVKDQHA